MSAPVLDRAGILALVPHQGAMCLWDQVVAWDDQRIRLRAGNQGDPAHPLRARGRLHALALCEYGAQAMAVHGGLLAAGQGGRAPAGVLVALRDVELAVARIDDLDGALEGEAELVAASAASQQYAFRIHHGGRLLARGRAAAVLGAELPG
ncbi:phosphotransferase [Pseudoxanthomonas sp. 10H]|uniref:phosphotransferase n=1 Tax=Pseudoxanthomonas sp. 10H TaxID=3242729 RepID=UPI0035587273